MQKISNLHRVLYVFVVLVIVLTALPASAAVTTITQPDLRLLKDINTTSYSGSDPGGLFVHNGMLYFVASHPTYGRELWQTNGTPASTRLVKDINPGPTSGISAAIHDPDFFGALGNDIFFPANDGSGSGVELWKSDGSEPGTVMVKDINAGGDASPDNFIAMNGSLFFTAQTSTGLRLLRTDGSEPGTTAFDGFTPYLESGTRDMAVWDGWLYLSARDEANGCELWRVNEAGQAELVADIAPAGDSNPGLLTQAGDWLYFIASDGQHGRELWKTSGSSAEMVRDLAEGAVDSSPFGLIAFQNSLFFFTSISGQNALIWRSDGTMTGTLAAADLGQGSTISVEPPAIVGNSLFFYAWDQTNGGELWKTDGTSAEMVRDINPGPGIASSGVGHLTEMNGILYFTAHNLPQTNIQQYNEELWRSDGTRQGTYMVKDINPGDASAFNYYPLVPFQGRLYFAASPFGGFIAEFWSSDGSEAGTQMFIDLNPSSNGASISTAVPFGSSLVFTANDGIHGQELWITYGGSAGTHMIKDLIPGSESGGSMFTSYESARPVEAGGLLYFAGIVPVNGSPSYALLVTNGIEAGTQMLKPVLPQAMSTIGSTVYFLSGSDLYKTNGTPQGTLLLKNLNSDLRTNGFMKAIDGKMYFELKRQSDGALEWWQTDGTATGTVPAVITPKVDLLLLKGGKQLSNGLYLYTTAGRLYQTSDPAQPDQEVLGDYKVINAEWRDKNWVYFISRTDTSNHYSLMRTQGNETGVQLVDEYGDYIYSLIGEHVYYRHWDNNGRFLALAGGDPLVMEVFKPLSGDYSFGAYQNTAYFAEVNNLVYFVGYTAEAGLELWASDGTPENTRLYADLNPGTNGSSPKYLANLGGRLVFAADDGVYGDEWWVIGEPDKMLYLPAISR